MAETPRIDTLSVVFTDVVGSTEIRSRLGDGDADRLFSEHDVMVETAIGAHRGALIKGLGDGFLATFGSAADAVGAAVAIQQGADAHSRQHPGRAFALRVGVSAGDVSVHDGDVFGTPVVEASRLCDAAVGGEILVAEVVRALARARTSAVFENMGELELRGLSDPLPACRVVWAPATVASGAPFPGLLVAGAVTDYVGRADVLSRLRASWRSAATGGCRAVLLTGEPGVGKTRTAAELARVAHEDGAPVLYGRCDEEMGIPYQPFVEALDFYTLHLAEPQLGRLGGELRRLLPELGERVAGLPDAVVTEARVEEYRLFESVGDWLIAASRRSGLVLVIDDAHWATKPTLLLLEHAIRAAGAADPPARLLVIATYRDTDVDRGHPLWSVLGDLRRLQGIERVVLEGLHADDVEELIRAAAGHDLDNDIRALARTLHAETEGNPFFLGEVVRHLIETGAVRREGDRWVVSDPSHVSLPEGVRDVVGRRMSRLSDAANTALSVASVVGRDWPLDVVAAVSGVEEDALLDAVDEAVRARIVEALDAQRYRFSHALVQETLYGELSAARRLRLHRRVAQALEQLRPGDVAALANHWQQVGPGGEDLRRAIRYTLAAGREAQQSRALALAETRYRQVIELDEDAPDINPAVLIDALIGLGECQRDQGELGYRETLLDASSRAQQAGDAQRLTAAVLANWRGVVSLVGEVDHPRLSLCERALESVGDAPSAARARLLAQLAAEVVFLGDNDRRVALADEAEALARRLGDERLLAEVLVRTSYAAVRVDRLEALLPRTQDAMRLADAAGDTVLRADTRMWASVARLWAGDVVGYREILAQALHIALQDGSPIQQWILRSVTLADTISRGQLGDAQQELDDVLALGERIGQPDAVQWWLAGAYSLAWVKGQVGDTADAAGAAAEQLPGLGIWHFGQAVALGRAGRLAEARAVLAAYPPSSYPLDSDSFPFVGYWGCATAAWLIGDAELGAFAAAGLEQHRGRWIHGYLSNWGPVQFSLGLAELASGRIDAGITDLEAAFGEAGAKGCAAIATVIGLDLATALTRRGAAGDIERARALLDAVRAAARDSGATGIGDSAERLAASISGG